MWRLAYAAIMLAFFVWLPVALVALDGTVIALVVTLLVLVLVPLGALLTRT